MNDLTALEGRIATALDRIGAGVEQIGDGAALIEIRKVNAVLVERVKALKCRLHEQEVAQKTQMAKLDAELQTLRAAHDGLQDALASSSPDAVDAGLTALKSHRAADLAEMDAILAALKPLVEEA